MMTDTMKAIFVILTLIVWGYFAAQGSTPIEPFIQTLRELILGLGLYHATLKDPKDL